MGFTTGFAGGFTLTASILYFTVQLHRSNRYAQSSLLHQQSLVLRNAIEPLPPGPEPEYRDVRVSLVESAKSRWNSEIEGLMRRAVTTDWDSIRDRSLERLGNIWQKGRAAFSNARSTSEALTNMEKNAPGHNATKREG